MTLRSVVVEATYTVSTDAWLERKVVRRCGHGSLACVDDRFWLVSVQSVCDASAQLVASDSTISALPSSVKTTLTRVRIVDGSGEEIEMKMPRVSSERGLSVMCIPERLSKELRQRFLPDEGSGPRPTAPVGDLVRLHVLYEDAEGNHWPNVRQAWIGSPPGFASMPGAQALDATVLDESYGCSIFDSDGNAVGVLVAVSRTQPCLVPVELIHDVVGRVSEAASALSV